MSKTEFYFDRCPHCGFDITEAFLSDGVPDVGGYVIECPSCGKQFGLVFTYSVMTYEINELVEAFA